MSPSSDEYPIPAEGRKHEKPLSGDENDNGEDMTIGG